MVDFLLPCCVYCPTKDNGLLNSVYLFIYLLIFDVVILFLLIVSFLHEDICFFSFVLCVVASWRRWVPLIDCLQLLSESSSLSREVLSSLHVWFEKYTDWLLNSKHGRQAGQAKNNHATWWGLLISLSLFPIFSDTQYNLSARSISSRQHMHKSAFQNKSPSNSVWTPLPYIYPIGGGHAVVIPVLERFSENHQGHAGRSQYLVYVHTLPPPPPPPTNDPECTLEWNSCKGQMLNRYEYHIQDLLVRTCCEGLFNFILSLSPYQL